MDSQWFKDSDQLNSVNEDCIACIGCWIFHGWKAIGFSIRNLVDLCYFNKAAFSFSPPVLTQLVWKWMEWTSSCSTRVSCMTFQVPLSSSGLIKHYYTQQPSSSLLFPLGFAVQSYMPKANFATQTIIAKIKMHLIKNCLKKLKKSSLARHVRSILALECENRKKF